VARTLIAAETSWERRYGFSRAVRLDNFVMVAGTTAVDARGRVVARDSPGGQARFVYQKIARALAEAGASLADVVRVRIFVTDMGRWQEVAEAHSGVFATIQPAATLVKVSGLMRPGLLVEIEVDAIVPADRWPRGGAGLLRHRDAATAGATNPSVLDEFGTLRTAILHDGRNATDVTKDDLKLSLPASELAQNLHVGPSSKARLLTQHAALRRCLVKRGVTILAPAAQPGAFGQVFTRDPCFVIGERVFVGGLHDDWRHAEADGLFEILSRCEFVTDLSGDGATIEGGDVMVLDAGRRVLVGLSRHSNLRGFRKLSAALDGSRVEVVNVPHDALHLDCCLAPLPDGDALYASAWLPRSSVSTLARYFKRLIPLNRDEAARHLAANMVWLDRQTVISSTSTKQTNALLRRRGYDVIELEFTDLVRQWGGFRCAVCPIRRS
jgi:N-dimethylarginine dimethylaminohydrolase/enamine deaminase RidA (YjgF/YER057c/UK114 family)